MCVRKKAVAENLSTSKKVFIVHGHQELVREKCARLVGKLGLEPIILYEQPNQGRTIIEKLEQSSDVSYAIVLLTADDTGTAGKERENLKPRARQNVILELGYFCGSLGRNRVCALCEQGVEMPTDYLGVVYIPIDARGAWELLVAKEMKMAGLPVDLNRI